MRIGDHFGLDQVKQQQRQTAVAGRRQRCMVGQAQVALEPDDIDALPFAAHAHQAAGGVSGATAGAQRST